MNFKCIALCASGLILTCLSACSVEDTPMSAITEMNRDIITPEGAKLGTLSLKTLEGGATEVTVHVKNLSAGTHAMHFHETGLCEGPDFKSAGGHYNPKNTNHGIKAQNGPHAGDMMNLDVTNAPVTTFTIVNTRVSIDGQNALPPLLDEDGSALILHQKPDDYKTQPTGAAGARIGCATITR